MADQSEFQRGALWALGLLKEQLCARFNKIRKVADVADTGPGRN